MIEKKDHNIIVRPDSDNEFTPHTMASDGKQTKTVEELRKEESRDFQREALQRHYDDLRQKNVKCAIVAQRGKKPCIAGKHRGEPFVVYLKVFYEGEEWAAILVTRYKGEDTEMIPPYEVLKR